MTTNLLKRLESSVHAFRKTLGALSGNIGRTQDAIAQFEAAGGAATVEDLDIDLETVAGDDDDFADFSVGKKIKIDLADQGAPLSPMERLYDITFRDEHKVRVPQDPPLFVPVQAEEQADIDISGDAFDFVRSIRVYHIQFSQREIRDGDCNRYDSTRLGSYGVQGDYRWTRSSVADVPPASQLPEPVHCRSISYRSVFVDWRDHEGNYGFEEVRY